MKLYYIPFACSQAIHILLQELNMSYQLVAVDPATKVAADGENYLDINPNGYVPALVTDNGDIISEVPAVMQYLVGISPDSALAVDRELIAITRLQSLLNFLSSELHKAFVPYWYQSELSGKEREEAYLKLAKRMKYIETLLADERKFLLGDDYSIADIYAFVLISWCSFHDINLDAWPNVANFYKRLASRSSVNHVVTLEGTL